MKRRLARTNALWIVLVLGVCFLAAATMAADKEKDYKYVASKQGKRYHLPSCSAAQRIKTDHLIGFNSAQEALKAGYTPCKVCKPPVDD
jgi:methylphosphotriester-DNA--protein-cysteine methyltransferase